MIDFNDNRCESFLRDRDLFKKAKRTVK